MKFRIVETGRMFYPQIKHFLFWRPLPCGDRSGMTTAGGYKGSAVCAFNTDDAMELICRYVRATTSAYLNAAPNIAAYKAVGEKPAKAGE